MPAVTRQNDTLSVPNLQGKFLPEALSELHANALVLGDTTSRVGTDHLQGIVADQSPRPNSFVKKGRRIYLEIYRGFEPDVIVPNVVEQSLREAREVLTAAGLRIHSEKSDRCPFPPYVTKISPTPGSPLPLGDSVEIWYGPGQSPNLVEDVPDVVGRTYEEARHLLRASCWWPSLLDRKQGEDNPVILRQSPEPGKRLQKDQPSAYSPRRAPESLYCLSLLPD